MTVDYLFGFNNRMLRAMPHLPTNRVDPTAPWSSKWVLKNQASDYTYPAIWLAD